MPTPARKALALRMLATARALIKSAEVQVIRKKTVRLPGKPFQVESRTNTSGWRVVKSCGTLEEARDAAADVMDDGAPESHVRIIDYTLPESTPEEDRYHRDEALKDEKAATLSPVDAAEKEQAKKGLCIWQIEYGMGRAARYCSEKATDGYLCSEHAQDYKDLHPERQAASLVQIQMYLNGEPTEKIDAADFRTQNNIPKTTFLMEAVRAFNAQQKAEGTGISAAPLQWSGKPVDVKARAKKTVRRTSR